MFARFLAVHCLGLFVVLFQLSLTNLTDVGSLPECLERLNSWQPPKGPFWLGWCHRGPTFCWPGGAGWDQSSILLICLVSWKRIPAVCRFLRRSVAKRADAAPASRREEEKVLKLWIFHDNGSLSLAKILTSSAFWSNASTRFTRKSKQSSVKRSVRALSNPGGAGDISKGFLLPYCMQFMLRWEKLLSHQLSETHQEIKWDVSWWLAGQVGEDNLQTIRGWVGPHVSTTTWQGKEM